MKGRIGLSMSIFALLKACGVKTQNLVCVITLSQQHLIISES